ncbi:unnamed protein product, partial [marine sediment metagenome]
MPKIARALVNLSGVKEKELFLDPFCGTGGILIEAGEIGARVIGIDVQGKMVRGAEENLGFYGLNGNLIVGDASKIASWYKRSRDEGNDVKEAVRHMKLIMGDVRSLKGKNEEELRDVAKELKVSFGLVQETADLQRLTVVNFAAGGVATPADAALMMQLGADGVFVGSGIFKSEEPEKMAFAIVEAVNNYDDAKKLAEISKGLGIPMKG